MSTKISDLTSYTTPIATDLFPIVDITNTITKKITWADLFKAPTFQTSLTGPLLIGGTGTTSTLTYKTTTGVGTTGADHIFLVGNNGATEAMRILNSGYVGIGNSSPASILSVGAVTTALSTLTNPEAFNHSITGATNSFSAAFENRLTSSASAGALLLLLSNDGAAMASGDRLGLLIFGGSISASTVKGSAGIASFAEELWVDDTSRGSYLSFETTDLTTITRSRKMQISANGNIVLGAQSALATNATDGFTYIPTCAGAPSGVPTAYTGKVAMVLDTTNNKLMIYDGGWIGVTLS